MDEFQNKLISVILTVYDEKMIWIEQSISSILNQTYRNIEVIVVVDKPENIEAIKYISDISFADARVKIHVNKENIGLVSSLNYGLSVCNGEFIARMDADDISNRMRLEKQISYLLNNSLDLVGSSIEIIDENSRFVKNYFKITDHLLIKKLLEKGVMGVVHPTFLFRKSALISIGNYNDIKFVEDMDFLARLILKGYRVGNLKDILLSVRYRDASITKNNAYELMMNTREVARQFVSAVHHGTPYEPKNHIIGIDFLFKIRRVKFGKQLISIALQRKANGKSLTFIFYCLSAFFVAPELIHLVYLKFNERIISLRNNFNI